MEFQSFTSAYPTHTKKYVDRQKRPMNLHTHKDFTPINMFKLIKHFGCAQEWASRWRLIATEKCATLLCQKTVCILCWQSCWTDASYSCLVCLPLVKQLIVTNRSFDSVNTQWLCWHLFFCSVFVSFFAIFLFFRRICWFGGYGKHQLSFSACVRG